MKPFCTLVIALLGCAAVLAPAASQARDVQLSLPGISVRLPAPPFPILLPPFVETNGGHREVYHREPHYRRVPPPRFYRDDWRFDHRDYRHARHHYGYDRYDRHDDRRDDRRDKRDHDDDHDNHRGGRGH